MPFTVAPTTRSPGPFSTGIGSPVSIDSSTALVPATTSPSTGSPSPGRTTITSPGRTSSTDTSTSAPSRTTRALRGWSCTSFRSAADVCRFARASSMLPTQDEGDDEDDRLVVDVGGHAARARRTRARRVAATDSTYAAPVPTATRVFMSAEWWRKAAHARV